MNPCRNKRENLALLAVGELEADSAQQLRAHMGSCEGCRDYFQEMQQLAQKLAAPELPHVIETSERFHQRVVRAIAAEQERSPLGSAAEWFAWLRGTNARVAWGVVVVVLAGVVAIAVHSRSPKALNRVGPALVNYGSVTSAATPDLQPSFANYQRMVNRSPEALDQLLERQVEQQQGEVTGIYTAGARSL